MGLVLKPQELKNAAQQMRTSMARNKTGYSNALLVIQKFAENEQLDSESWDTAKFNMSAAHQLITQGMQAVQEAIERDLNTLETSIGDEDLDEDELLASIERLTNECIQYEETIRNLQRMAARSILCDYVGMQTAIGNYKALLEQTRAELEIMKEKLEELREKSDLTAGLLQMIVPLISALEYAINDAKVFITGQGVFSNSNWMTTITKVINDCVIEVVLKAEFGIDLKTFEELYGEETINEIRSYIKEKLGEINNTNESELAIYILQSISGYTVNIVDEKYQFNDGKWNLLKKYSKDEIKRIVKKEQVIDTVPEIVTCKMLENCGWDINILGENMIRECNLVLDKYEINTPERLSCFMAQCSFESGYGQYTYETGSADYFSKKSYGSKYRGVGYIQMTWDYSYQAFAMYLILEEFPELGECATYKSPASNGREVIKTEYNKIVKAAKEQKLDISDYTDIVDIGYTYVSDVFAWECAGYDWTVKNLNEVVDNGGTINDVSKVINRWDTASFSKREQIYNNIINQNIFN